MQKGGVGKSTSSKNEIEELGKKFKVLGIDNDQNADLTDSFTSKKVVERSGAKTLYDVYTKGASIRDVRMSITDNIDIVPSNIELSSKMSREFVLKKAIDEIKEEYDYIIIDCSPSLSITTINALAASDGAIYITQLEYFAKQALEQLEKTVNLVKEINPNLETLGLLLTMSDSTNHVKDMIEELKESDYRILGQIDRATVVRDSIMAKQAVFQYDSSHKVAKQYHDFVNNMIKELEK